MENDFIGSSTNWQIGISKDSVRDILRGLYIGRITFRLLCYFIASITCNLGGGGRILKEKLRENGGNSIGNATGILGSICVVNIRGGLGSIYIGIS
jgi:hypothetical protein